MAATLLQPVENIEEPTTNISTFTSHLVSMAPPPIDKEMEYLLKLSSTTVIRLGNMLTMFVPYIFHDLQQPIIPKEMEVV